MSTGLNVTIIGAGLGGLAAARALREHNKVTMVERWGGGHEVGAAINMGATANKWLGSVGFSRQKAGAIKATRAISFKKDGTLIAETDMSVFSNISKADWTFQHRADLFNELLRLATCPSEELGIGGNPAKVLWSCDAVHIDVDSGLVTLADGRKIESDLVVGADGVKSTVRPLVVGQAAFDTARPSGSSAYRFTIPGEQVKAKLGNYRVLDREKPAGLFVHLALDASNRSIVLYPCRNFDLLNVVSIVPDSMIDGETLESWTASGTREELLRHFDDFDDEIKTLLGMAEDVKLWQLRDQDPLPTYIKGRTLLLGDAAHAMTPHQGQGGTQAMEDAEGLHNLFGKSGMTRNAVGASLKDYDRVRRTRASQVQNNTRDSHDRKNTESMYRHNLYNWTYPGMEQCLRNLDAGKPMIELQMPS